MKKILLSLLLITVFPAFAHEYDDDPNTLFYESFENVDGKDSEDVALDPSVFNNPEGWDFDKAFAGKGCVIVKKGGHLTIPKMPELIGNAAIGLYLRPLNDEVFEDGDFDFNISLSADGAALSIDKFDPTISSQYWPCILDGNGDTRFTIHADYDIIISEIRVFYAPTGTHNWGDTDLVKFSHSDGKEYVHPFDLTLTGPGYDNAGGDGSQNIIVYTTDGTTPQRTSTRYDGTPIRINGTTTIYAGVIFATGAFYTVYPVTYSFAETPDVEIPENTFEVTLTKPGTLKNAMLDIDADVLEGLIIHGAINSTDLAYLISAEGRAGAIKYLDLSDVKLDYDDGYYTSMVYAPEGGMGHTTIINYYLTYDNWEECTGASPSSTTYSCGRNDLECAFAKHPKLARVVLPKWMTRVGERAFARVSMATLPDGVEEIGSYAFSQCVNINLPASIRTIGDSAFGKITGDIDLPELEYVGINAFYDSYIGSFKFYDKLKRIGAGAFARTSLKEVYIPVAPDTIPESIFSDCEFLEKVNIEGNSTVLGKNAFYGCDAITEFSLPSTLEEVGADAIPQHLLPEPEDGIIYFGKTAYRKASDMAEYTIKDGTVCLAEDLFNGLTHYFGNVGLTKVTLPKSLRRIGKRAFAYTSLTSTPAMDGVTHIGDEAFSYCRDLAKVVIPESMKYIGWGVFLGCDNIWNVAYNAVFADIPYGLDLRDVERVTIGDKVSRLPSGLFTGNTNVTEVILPESLEVIDKYAFDGCVNLEYVHLSDNVSKISDNAFSGCRSLSDLHWPLHLDSIGRDAFHGCESLTVISLPEGTRSVAEYAFYGCENVHTLYIASTIYDIEPNAFYTSNYDTDLTVTCTAEIPPYYEWYWIRPATIKVPAEYMESYRTEPYWNGSYSGKENQIIPLGEIAASTKGTSTGFDTAVDENTDLSDAVVGDVYVTVGEGDSYDSTDGSIVLYSTMTDEQAEAIGGMAPGKTDLSNRFNGIVAMVPAGSGKITVQGLTAGGNSIGVKIGENEPRYYTRNSKGEITVDYDVDEDTFVYIYGSEQASGEATVALRPISDTDYVKIYSIGVTPEKLGIYGIPDGSESDSPITDYYTIDGVKVTTPTAAGIYIVRRADGTTSKILVK